MMFQNISGTIQARLTSKMLSELNVSASGEKKYWEVSYIIYDNLGFRHIENNIKQAVKENVEKKL